jgi:hypothetical protein
MSGMSRRSILNLGSFALLILAISLNHPYQNASAHSGIVVINEVELDPPGNNNDTSSVSHVEIYNGGSYPQDVSGWSVGSSAEESVRIKIDDNTIIPAKGFLVVGQGSEWLRNTQEIIVMKNKDGFVIDTAGPFSDEKGDPMTWQRSADRSTEWVFRLGTIGSSNGEEVEGDVQSWEVAPFVYGGAGSPFGPIEGNYTDPTLGLGIELPEGWSGVGFPGFAMITPHGSPFASGEVNLSTSMVIVTVNVTDMAQPRSPIFTEQQLTDSLSAPSPSLNYTMTCTDKQSYEKLNDMVVMHAFSECKDSNDPSKYTVSNIYNAARKGQIIGVGLSSNSAQEYEKYLDEFERSVITLKVKDAIDHRTVWVEPLGMKSMNQTVEVNGSKVDVRIESNYELSNFMFDEEQKRLSFRAEGDNRTIGLTLIPMGNFLEGPYSVTVDGQVREDFRIFDDQVAGGSLVEINYEQNSHNIVITGTNVVPEFPLQIAGVLAATIGIVAFIARMRFGLSTLSPD